MMRNPPPPLATCHDENPATPPPQSKTTSALTLQFMGNSCQNTSGDKEQIVHVCRCVGVEGGGVRGGDR